jgi:hypothetical protein
LFLYATCGFNSPSSSSLDEKSAECEGEETTEDGDEGDMAGEGTGEVIVGEDGVCRFKKEGRGKDSGSGEYSNAPPA